MRIIKMHHLATVIISVCGYSHCDAQYNDIFKSSIRSLQVVKGTDWLSMPVIKLGEYNENNVINIAFDDLTHTYERYTYSIEHCEADWTTTESLFQSDYLEGFASDNVIEDVEESINTNVLYTHYKLSIPNDQCKIKLGGNYRITVIDDNTNEKVLSVCFMVLEADAMGVSLEASTNTDIDINKSHQQIAMKLSYNGFRVVDPSEQIKTVVLQNGRWDNAKINVKPQYTTVSGLQWIHNKDLIFKAGNEYHKFETLATSHPTMGIDKISWDGKNYHAFIFKDEPRPSYVYDEDANGSFYIRNSDNIENDRSCDYMYTHFSLQCPEPVNGDVYINGVWTNDCFLPEYKMKYNENRKQYEGCVLLKQGYYSYQYVMLTPNGTTAIMPTEGSFFQTENKYQALVYFRGQGERTDRLVGYKQIQIK